MIGKAFFILLLLIGVIGVGWVGVSLFQQYGGFIAKTNNPNSNFVIPTAADDPALGNPNAPVQIIAFEDFQCPYCKEEEPILKQILSQYPNDIYFVYRHFPVYTKHPQGMAAAQAADCAREQGQFWKYHDLLYANQDQFAQAGIFVKLARQLNLNVTQFSSCVSTEKYKDHVQQDFDQGYLAGVNQTPTFFVNGQIIAGEQSLEVWQQIITQAKASITNRS